MLVIPPLRQARIAVVLLFILVTVLLLKNNQISFHQSSNFVLSLSNHPRFGTMLLGSSTCLFCIFSGTSAINISSVYSIVFSEMSSVIFNNPSLFNNASILYSQYWSVLLSMVYATSILYLPMVNLSVVSVA